MIGVKRLPKGKRTEKIYQEGKRLVDPKWVLIYCDKQHDSETYIGIHTRKKFGNAVERNRIRRQVREAIRSAQISDLPFDVIVIPRTSVKGVMTKEITKKFEILFNRLKRVEISK